MLQNKFSYYDGNIYEPICRGYLTVKDLVGSLKNPTKRTTDLLTEIQKASLDSDFVLKHKLKAKLHYVTPAVLIPREMKRTYGNIHHFTGIMQLDFDKLKDGKEAVDFKEYLFNQYETIICAFVSPSGLGVKALMHIQVSEDIEEYKDFHKGAEEEFNQYNGWDHATINCALPMFIGADKDILYRDDADCWDVKGDRTVAYAHMHKAESLKAQGQPDYVKQLQTIELFKRKIDEIQDGDGHPRMRSACLVLGSRSGAGYIDQQQAEELAMFCLASNSYLVKKYTTYIKTAIWAINEGVSHPQYY